MAKKNPLIDAYIAKSADFAQPILNHFRELVHASCPDVIERIKWGFPHFDYNGGPMAHMAAFKQHCAIGFWKAPLMKNGEALVAKAKSEEAMGHFGKIASLKALPNKKVMVAYIREAMRLNEAGLKMSAKKALAKTALNIPRYFSLALSKNKKAEKTFQAFSYSNKKEYVQWVSEAKTDSTREKRLKDAIEWMAEGKVRNWKYLSKK